MVATKVYLLLTFGVFSKKKKKNYLVESGNKIYVLELHPAHVGRQLSF
jgi:phosphoribosylpyrophosphate synthetase